MTRIASGVTDQGFYFVAVDATDFTSRETGLSSWTVYRERNNGTASVMTTPTITEVDATNMPGVYFLTCDEDTTIDAGDETQEQAYHITHAGMAPVTHVVELFRPKVTAGETLTVASGVGSADVTAISGDSTAADNLESYTDGTTPMPVNATQISGDATAADNLENAFDDTAGPVTHMGIVDQGTAQSATSTTLVLRASAAFADDELIGATIVITGGSTGVGQARKITDYVSSSDTATVAAWTTTPTGTITYKIYGSPPGSSGATAQEVWEYSTRVLTANTNLNDLDAAGVRSAVGLAAANLDTQIAALPTAAENRTEMDSNSTQLAAIVADTGELQGDWVNGGRLDLLIDGIKAKTDSLTFTVAGYVASDIRYVIGDAVQASSSKETNWGGTP